MRENYNTLLTLKPKQHQKTTKQKTTKETNNKNKTTLLINFIINF